MRTTVRHGIRDTQKYIDFLLVCQSFATGHRGTNRTMIRTRFVAQTDLFMGVDIDGTNG
jgi:hypothetical protein